MENCNIPEFWCGSKRLPKKDLSKLVYYTRKGTPYECLKRGVGVGKRIGKKIPETSLQNIRYVGDVIEKKLKKLGISDILSLIQHSKKDGFYKLLLDGCRQKNYVLNKRAYNSILWYLKSLGYAKKIKCFPIAPN